VRKTWRIELLYLLSKKALIVVLAAIEEEEDAEPYELFSTRLDVPLVKGNPASIRARV
jgi:hypothetical protein